MAEGLGQLPIYEARQQRDLRRGGSAHFLHEPAVLELEAAGVLVRALLAWARAHGRRFYNFSGLEAFKTKLQPDAWEPVYVLSRERATSLRTLYAVAGAFAGEAIPAFLARAVLRAARQELQGLRGRLGAGPTPRRAGGSPRRAR